MSAVVLALQQSSVQDQVVMVLLNRKLIVVVTLAVIIFLSSFMRANAQQQIVIKMDFEFLRQGTAGLVLLTGPDVVGAVASTMDRTFPFFPTTEGYACLLAAPMEQRIKDYPMTITITRRDGSTTNWDGVLKVASGQFIAEAPFSLPSDKLYLLSDEVQASEDKKLYSAYDLVTPVRFWEGAFTMPANGPLSSPYGTVRSYNGIVSRRHTGYDIRAQSGTPVLASASGRVVLSRPLDIHGNNIVIDHGWGIYSEYAHLSERYVVPGQFVLQGDLIGLSGNTGRSTGPHIHWEIAVNGVVVNPIAFMQIKLPN